LSRVLDGRLILYAAQACRTPSADSLRCHCRDCGTTSSSWQVRVTARHKHSLGRYHGHHDTVGTCAASPCFPQHVRVRNLTSRHSKAYLLSSSTMATTTHVPPRTLNAIPDLFASMQATWKKYPADYLKAHSDASPRTIYAGSSCTLSCRRILTSPTCKLYSFPSSPIFNNLGLQFPMVRQHRSSSIQL
jgi:hypothetical protein